MAPAGTLKQRIHQGDIILGLQVSITIERSRLEAALTKDFYDYL